MVVSRGQFRSPREGCGPPARRKRGIPLINARTQRGREVQARTGGGLEEGEGGKEGESVPIFPYCENVPME